MREMDDDGKVGKPMNAAFRHTFGQVDHIGGKIGREGGKERAGRVRAICIRLQPGLSCPRPRKGTCCYAAMAANLEMRTCSSIQRYVVSNPSQSGRDGAHPSLWRIRRLSEFLPRTPSGPGMCLIRSGFPARRMAISAN